MKNPKSCINIEEIREAIDDIDYQIMKLYSERYEFVKEIVKFKTDETSIIAEDRQEEVIAQRRAWAIELGLNPDLFEKIYRTLMRFNIQKELDILRNQKHFHV
jgi:isochorismate pyruvate lyase